MITPDIKYYARFVDATGSKKTPKYTVTKQAGYFPQMETQRGKDYDIGAHAYVCRRDDSRKGRAEIVAPTSCDHWTR